MFPVGEMPSRRYANLSLSTKRLYNFSPTTKRLYLCDFVGSHIVNIINVFLLLFEMLLSLSVNRFSLHFVAGVLVSGK
jgi:hypothetical protein